MSGSVGARRELDGLERHGSGSRRALPEMSPIVGVLEVILEVAAPPALRSGRCE